MKKRRGFLFWVIIVFLVAAVAGAYAMTRLLRGEERPSPSTKKGPEIELGVFTVDLEPDGRSPGRLLRVSVVLEGSSKKAQRELRGRSAEVRHAVVSVLRGRGAQSLHGAEGMRSLQADIQRSVNTVLGADLITGVYFPEFVMQ